jgi:holo-[acyl-carrier protein] synthase
MNPLCALAQLPAAWGPAPVRVGLDLVEISRIQESLDRFGDRFLRRLFSDGEIAYAQSRPSQSAEHLAARFAAKEAAIKAFALAEAGMAWRDIEVQRHDDGACHLALHGRAAEAAERLGVTHIALSLSHDGDYAGAVVTALCGPQARATSSFPTSAPQEPR